MLNMTTKTLAKEATKRAADYVGSAAELARRLGITKGAVSQWTDEVPAEHCPTIEKITKGTVVCEELNSKTDWEFIRSTKKRIKKPISV